MEQPPPILESQSPPSKATSVAARLLNVFAIPGEVFDEVKAGANSTANWLAPALMLILVSWVGGWLILSQPAIQQQMSELTDKAIQKQVEKGKLTKDQAELARKSGEISARVGAVAAPVVAAFATPFCWGLILWLVGTKVLPGNFPYIKAVEVAGLANTILVLEAVVRTLLVVGLGNPFASPSPVLLVREFDPQKTAHSLLALVNLMTFWLLAVRSVGLARLSGVPFPRAGAWVFGIWAGYMVFILMVGQVIRAVFGF